MTKNYSVVNSLNAIGYHWMSIIFRAISEVSK